MNKAAYLVTWIGMLSAVFAQQPPAPPNGDGLVSSARGQAEAPAQAAQTLYKLASQITGDPSSGYQTPRGDQSDWPAEEKAQRQWHDAMAARGNELSRQDRARLIPCAAHLLTAIDAMERGYRIEISQKGNSAAQQSVQTLYARGRKEFGLCRPTDVLLASTSETGVSPDASSLQQLQIQMQELQQRFRVLQDSQELIFKRLEVIEKQLPAPAPGVKVDVRK